MKTALVCFFCAFVLLAVTSIGKAENEKGVLVEKPAIVPLGEAQILESEDKNIEALNFVFNTLDKERANWIFYPYNITFLEPSPSARSDARSQTIPYGGFVSTMNKDNFPPHSDINWVESETDIRVKKAKTVYDTNVAILRIVCERQDEDGMWGEVDITNNSESYGNLFYSNLYPKYTKVFEEMSDYKEWLQSNPTQADKPVVVFLSPNDIKTGSLKTSTRENFFGVLVIPDVLQEEVSYFEKLLTSFKDKVKSFINDGGVLLTTGRGAFAAEAWGLIPDSTFDTRYSLSSPNLTWQYNEGCDMIRNGEPVDDSESEFQENTLCFALPRWKDSEIVNGFTSAPLMTTPEKSHGLHKLLYFKNVDPNNRIMKHDDFSGFLSELEYTNPRSYPSLMYKTIGKGCLIINAGNPSLSNNYSQFVYNSFILAATRPLALDDYIVDAFNRTVPAAENVGIKVNLRVTNYFTSDFSVATLYVYSINGTTVTPPSGCSVVTSGTPSVPSSINTSVVFSCSFEAKKLSTEDYLFNVRVADPLLFQQNADVVVLYSILQYVDSNRNSMKVSTSCSVKVQFSDSVIQTSSSSQSSEGSDSFQGSQESQSSEDSDSFQRSQESQSSEDSDSSKSSNSSQGSEGTLVSLSRGFCVRPSLFIVIILSFCLVIGFVATH